jgi:hypothetical protein
VDAGTRQPLANLKTHDTSWRAGFAFGFSQPGWFRAGASSGQILKKFASVSEKTCIVLVD